jgi:predicted enzyme related to lactoylglutathione lyase
VRGQVAMIEIPAADPAQGREFYGGLFDWQFEAAPGRFEYRTTQISEQTGGAIQTSTLTSVRRASTSRWT